MTRPVLLLVGPSPPPVHGNSVYTEMLLNSQRLGEAFRVVHLDTADRRSLENLGRLDLENLRLGLVHALRLGRLLVRHRPDLVYIPVSQNAWAYLRDAVFVVLARIAGARVVTHLHGGYFRRFYRETNPLMRAFIRGTSKLVSSAWVLGEELKPLYAGLVRPERIQSVPNGVPDPWTGNGPPAPPEDPFTVLYLGGLTRSKGVFDLLEALSILKERVPEARLILAGGWMQPEEEKEAQERLQQMALSESVQLPGVVHGRKKLGLFASAHVFAYPTFYPYEGQPLAILEAMAAGLPAVTTTRGAISDCVIDGETGTLVPERAPSELARVLGELARDGALRERMGQAARNRYLEDFTDRTCVERFVEALESVLEAIA